MGIEQSREARRLLSDAEEKATENGTTPAEILLENIEVSGVLRAMKQLPNKIERNCLGQCRGTQTHQKVTIAIQRYPLQYGPAHTVG